MLLYARVQHVAVARALATANAAHPGGGTSFWYPHDQLLQRVTTATRGAQIKQALGLALPRIGASAPVRRRER
jgi:hypothetical protein